MGTTTGTLPTTGGDDDDDDDDDNSGCLAAQATACEVECSPADTSSRVPDPTKTFYRKASKSPKITYTRLDVTFACDEAAGTGTCDVDCCDINDILPRIRRASGTCATAT